MVQQIHSPNTCVFLSATSGDSDLPTEPLETIGGHTKRNNPIAYHRIGGAWASRPFYQYIARQAEFSGQRAQFIWRSESTIAHWQGQDLGFGCIGWFCYQGWDPASMTEIGFLSTRNVQCHKQSSCDKTLLIWMYFLSQEMCNNARNHLDTTKPARDPTQNQFFSFKTRGPAPIY